VRVPFFDFVLWEDPIHLESVSHSQNLSSSDIPVTEAVWRFLSWTSVLKPSTLASKIPEVTIEPFHFHSWPFHVVTLFFHLATVFLVFWFFCFLTHHPMGSFLGALFFAIHPVQVESVAWVSGLKETLSGFLGILALFLFLIGQEKPPQSKSFKFYFLISSCCFSLSLFAHPARATLPFQAFVLLYFLYKKERTRVSGKHLLLWTFPLIPSLMKIPFLHLSIFQVPLKDTILLALDSLSFYFSKILFPWELGVDYGRNADWVFSKTNVPLTASLFFVFLFSLTLFLNWNKIRWALACQFFFLLSLLPVFLFPRHNFETSSTVADHDLYFALIGVGLCLAFWIKNVCRRPEYVLIAGGILTFFLTRSYFQTSYWENTSKLLTHALEVNPQSALAHFDLAQELERNLNYREALSHYVSSAELSPHASTYHRIASIYLTQGHFKEAKNTFEKALMLNPLSAQDYLGLGSSWAGLGDRKKAQDNLAKANALTPKNVNSAPTSSQSQSERLSKNKNRRRRS
jgi:protein O-mannosyl-transferase